ncbi:hypothetical protein QBC38DRAFT_453921 [Podospora fimiseda]|uniref:Uncharacterized protein n=1 Tax=Podospora fimiseda TaxID=252190 RepID=A0AAN7BSN7_9PEZI|nr:hypothetical protein QBC38DRAFT_453921 [Podospora fimiseda]
MPSTQIASPIPIPVPRGARGLNITTEDLFASLNATLQSKNNQLVTPNHHIREKDWSVPAPPPPSPIQPRAAGLLASDNNNKNNFSFSF